MIWKTHRLIAASSFMITVGLSKITSQSLLLTWKSGLDSKCCSSSALPIISHFPWLCGLTNSSNTPLLEDYLPAVSCRKSHISLQLVLFGSRLLCIFWKFWFSNWRNRKRCLFRCNGSSRQNRRGWMSSVNTKMPVAGNSHKLHLLKSKYHVWQVWNLNIRSLLVYKNLLMSSWKHGRFSKKFR